MQNPNRLACDRRPEVQLLLLGSTSTTKNFSSVGKLCIRGNCYFAIFLYIDDSIIKQFWCTENNFGASFTF
jgi:hypothetical protein